MRESGIALQADLDEIFARLDAIENIPPPVEEEPPLIINLMVSKVSSRGNASVIDEALIRALEQVFVFLDTDLSVDQVVFYLDNELIRTENLRPFDLAGGTVESANPTVFLDGLHTIKAEVTLLDGNLIIEKSFNVAPQIITEPEPPAQGDIPSGALLIDPGDDYITLLNNAGPDAVVAIRGEWDNFSWHIDNPIKKLYVRGVLDGGMQLQHAIFADENSPPNIEFDFGNSEFRYYNSPQQKAAIQLSDTVGYILSGGHMHHNAWRGYTVGAQMVWTDPIATWNGNAGAGGARLHGTRIVRPVSNYNNWIWELTEQDVQNLVARTDNWTIDPYVYSIKHYGKGIGWEGGAWKFVRCRDVEVIEPISLYNGGGGPWFDFPLENCHIYGGDSMYNLRPGVVFEITTGPGGIHAGPDGKPHRAWYNGLAKEIRSSTGQLLQVGDQWAWGGQVLLQDTADYMVEDVDVKVREDNGDGIVLVYQARRVGGDGPLYNDGSRNTMRNTRQVFEGEHGHTGTFGGPGRGNIQFIDKNEYILPSPNSRRFSLDPNKLNFAEWQAAGFDVNGSIG